MPTSTTRLTIDDFERLPQEMAEGHELVGGELIDVSGNVGGHNSIRDLLLALLLIFVREHRLGKVIGEQEYDFNGNAHGPDVSFFGLEKQPLFQTDKRVQRFVPDLAIEIVSQHDLWNSVMGRRQHYRSCGTAEVWILIPPSHEVFVFSEHGDRILGQDAELSTPLIPGFQITVKRLFEEI